MALHLGGSARNEFTRSTNVPSPTSFTILSWMRFAKRGTEDNLFFRVRVTGYACELYYKYSTDQVGVYATGYADAVFSPQPSVDTWYYWYMACDGTGAGKLVGGYAADGATSFTAVSQTGITFTSDYITFGGYESGANWWSNAHFYGLKVYDAKLTEAEIWQEMYSVVPRRTANLNCWLPMTSSSISECIKDESGNGNNFTQTGTPEITASPPVGYGITESGLYVPMSKPLYAQLDEAVRDSNDYVYL